MLTLKNTKTFTSFQRKTEPFVSGLELDRMYINAFAPSENPYFHTDSGVHTDITCLYYVNDTWSLDDGGATEFILMVTL